MAQRKNDRDGLRALALVGQVGLVMVAGVVCGLFGGVYLARRAGLGGIAVAAGVLVGIAAGGYGVYRIIAKEIPWNH